MSGRFGTFAVIAGLMLGGCGGSVARDPAASRPVAPTTGPTVSVTLTASPSPSQVAPTVPADVPTSGPNLKVEGERPPVMPVAATQHTRAGAVAFAEFFIRTMDWGYASVSSTYMRHYFTAACTICDGLADAIDRIAQKHYHVAGNRFEISEVSVARRGEANTAEFSVEVPVSVSSGEVVNDKGLFLEGQPALKLIEHVGVRYLPGGWHVVSFGTDR